jgi:hypothetical protein
MPNPVFRNPWTLVAFFSTMMLLGVAGCAASGGKRVAGTTPQDDQTGNSEPAPVGGAPSTPGAVGMHADQTGSSGAGTPGKPATPQPGLPPDIASFRPLDRSEVCPTPQVALALRLTDGTRHNGEFDPSTVIFALDGKNVIQDAAVLGTMNYPQSQVSITYTPKTALQPGMHQVSFTYPSAIGPNTLQWTFTVVVGNCPVGSVPGTHGGGNPPVGTTPQPGLSAEIAAFRPLDGSEVCSTPQLALALRLTEAMRKKGAFDPSTVILSLDGQDITQQSAILGTMDYPQSQVSITYKPKNALRAGMHQASFTYPSANGSKTLKWTFTVVSRPCP